MIILGIETTCDETGVGIVRDGLFVLANVVSSSSDLHRKYGGIVPEVAAREQVRLIVPVLEEAERSARCELEKVDAIAVAYGPGLVGPLMVGVESAKTLTLVLDKPLIAVNHLVGHIYANWINNGKNTVQFPLVALIVSGGHTDLILMKDHGKFNLIGSTRDDAAGEVFDKVARVLGLGYPGGPEIERLARPFRVNSSQFTVKFPRPMISENNFDFSFAGLKTSVVNIVKNLELSEETTGKIAAEFQNAVVDVLVKKTLRAAYKYSAKSIVVGGGVAANSLLRDRMFDAGAKTDIKVLFPSKLLSVDNGVMIAAAAFFEKNFVAPLRLQADSSLHF